MAPVPAGGHRARPRGQDYGRRPQPHLPWYSEPNVRQDPLSVLLKLLVSSVPSSEQFVGRISQLATLSLVQFRHNSFIGEINSPSSVEGQSISGYLLGYRDGLRKPARPELILRAAGRGRGLCESPACMSGNGAASPSGQVSAGLTHVTPTPARTGSKSLFHNFR